jgi:hypothetical protein
VLTIPQMSDFCLAYLSYARHHSDPLAHGTGEERRKRAAPREERWAATRAATPAS